MDKVKIIAGILIMVFGFFLIGIAVFSFSISEEFILILYGFALMILGFFVLIDFGKENIIEQVKRKK
jgi:hypothetical protein